MGFFKRRRGPALDELNDRLLGDLGRTRADAKRRARRPNWDIPEYWRGLGLRQDLEDCLSRPGAW